jgi:hypothetical protein
MKTLSARTLRIANLFTLATALVALCPRTTLAESGGSQGGDLPQPRMGIAYTDGTTITADSAANQPDGSITYINATVNWTNGVSKSAAWANVSTSGAILFSDGTTEHI